MVDDEDDLGFDEEDLSMEGSGPRPPKDKKKKEEVRRFEMPQNLDLLMDVPLDVSVRLGHVRMQIRDLLRLNKGSLIELEKEADEPLEIYVNNRLLAYGEVVMIKDKLGIRLTDIVSLAERLENLR